jgi:hypothetical protein
MVSFTLAFPPTPCEHLSTPPYAPHAPPISFFSILPPAQYWYRSFSSSLCNFLHYPVTSSLLGPNILLNTLFSYTFSLRSCLNVSDQVLHPYKTTAGLKVCSVDPKEHATSSQGIRGYNSKMTTLKFTHILIKGMFC